MTRADLVAAFLTAVLSLAFILFVLLRIRPRPPGAPNAALGIPTAEELSSFRCKEDWAIWFFEHNHHAPWNDAHSAWNRTDLNEQFGYWTSEELERARLLARATGDQRAELEEELAREHALEKQLLACDSWEAWLTVLIAAKPEMDLPTVRHEMTARSSSANSHAERERAGSRGTLPTDEQIEASAAAVAPLGRIMTRRREAQARAEAVERERREPAATRKRLRRRAWLIEFQTNGGVHRDAYDTYYATGLDERLGELDFVESLAWWSEAWRWRQARRREQAGAVREKRVARPWTAPLDVASFRSALARRGELEAPLARAAVAPELRALLAARGVPSELCAFLEHEFLFEDSFAVGPIQICSATALLTENTQPFNDECLEAGLLVMASCETDDPVVVDLESGSVGYVDHDELWTNEATPDARALFIDTGLGVGRFFLAAAQYAREFPANARAARALARSFAKQFPLSS
jgi:hypothetical protein